jgi:hypothetical protein
MNSVERDIRFILTEEGKKVKPVLLDLISSLWMADVY